MSYFRVNNLNSDKNLQAYIIGLAIGDGNLSNPSGRGIKLRITCDNKYPNLRERVINSLRELLPENKVGIVNKPEDNAKDVYVYSNHLENLLGWEAGKGSKLIQNVSAPRWIYESKDFIKYFLKGIIETDGSIYHDRGYPMVMITTIIKDLAEEIKNMIANLGFKAHIYKIDSRKNKYNFKKQIEYHIRLSKNVRDFLNLIKPDKS